MKSITVICSETENNIFLYKYLKSNYHINKYNSLDYYINSKNKKAEIIFLNIKKAKYKNKTYEDIFYIIKKNNLAQKIVILCPNSMIRESVKALKSGADTYLTYPIQDIELEMVLKDLYQNEVIESELEYLRNVNWDDNINNVAKTNSKTMKDIFNKIQSVAKTKATILLTGETGTGKGVLAKLIHYNSNRKNNNFISIHCGAIPENLIESELFGHEKGSFTGAIKRKLGKFEIAKGGTIFLDEISTISMALQIKLLQVLQDKTYYRVGGEEAISTDVRIIAATNTDLKDLVKSKLFREDLYYRLNVFPIHVPPLRERKEDIKIITNYMINKFNKVHTKNIKSINKEVFAAFNNYSWPGNIREMENLIERACIIESSHELRQTSFPLELFKKINTVSNIDVSNTTLSNARKKALKIVEQTYLNNLLKENYGIIKISAKKAGLTTRQLYNLLKKHNLNKNKYKL